MYTDRHGLTHEHNHALGRQGGTAGCPECRARNRDSLYRKRSGVKCLGCGAAPDAHSSYCEACRLLRRRLRKKSKRKARTHRKRARRFGVEYQVFDPRLVFERDDYVCGICGGPIDPAVRYPDYMSVSLDHIIPLARGGGHTPENTQPAHFICNSKKQDNLEA